MKVLKVGVSQFRSIGGDFITIDLEKKINVLVGINNSGKSNVLEALRLLANAKSHARGDQIPIKLTATDRHRRDNKIDPWFLFDAEFELPQDQNTISPVRGTFEFRFKDAKQFECRKSAFEGLSVSQFNPFMSHFIHQQYGGKPSTDELISMQRQVGGHAVGKLLREVFPPAILVPQFRQISEAENYEVNGRGIISLLASWQHPEIGHDHDYEKFRQVQDLLRRLLHMPNVALEVPHKQKEILVENGMLRLPLASYGTGVHEIIILAIAVLSAESALICIEEPEIHIHPLLQKELLSFLRTETTNRYILTTHSAALIAPGDDVAVTHLWLEDGVTRGRRVETSDHSLAILNDLGVKASDLLQANCVVWVEGPSDRIYLNRWLKLLAPDLREGIDYSIMFYGGRLLSHLAAEREVKEMDELIQLLRINQNSIILVDSDKKDGGGQLNATKSRIQDECSSNNLLCWITDGREIENYLPIDAIEKTYTAITGKPVSLKFGDFDRLEESLESAFGADWKTSWSYDKEKPVTARKLIEHITEANLSPPLKSHVMELIATIRNPLARKLLR